MLNNNWLEIWEKKGKDSWLGDKLGSTKEVFLELKKLDGFDVFGGGVKYESFIYQHKECKKMLVNETERRFSCKVNKIFEIGCGSGANLLLFEEEGYKVGGIDYSQSLIDIAKKVLQSNLLQCDEAVNINLSYEYDVVFSNSVFHYFPNYSYAETVLEKGLQISKYAIGLLDIHDARKKKDFIAFRKKEISNYEEKYANLPKLFYEKSFFESFAKKHNLDIFFGNTNMKDYWNNDFSYDVFLYKI